MSLQLMSDINNRYHLAVAVHRELADVFWFIYLPGYALWNEYQQIDESMTERKIKRYITSTYHTFSLDKLPKSANIAEPLIGGKNRKTLKSDEIWEIIKEAFRIYQEWEEATLKEYQRIAKELFTNGDISTFNFVGEIIKDVKAELIYVTDKLIELTAHDFDMPTIVAEQTNYFERYEKLIREFMGKSRMYHRHNSALDVESRTSVFEKHPD